MPENNAKLLEQIDETKFDIKRHNAILLTLFEYATMR